MPNIRAIELLADKIRVIKGNGQEIVLLISDIKIPPNATPEAASLFATEKLQALFEYSWRLDDPSWEGNLGRIGEIPPNLLPSERIEKVKGKDTYIVTEVFAAVYVFSLNPIKYTTQFSNEPIGGEWWL